VYAKEFFNLRASDKISLWRSLPDVRHQACQRIEYATNLPTASVIFIFKNERWSVILRSVYSVLNRSPRHLLAEVILVDDDSEIQEVKLPLENYCKKHFGDIVKIYRPTKRLGLIAAKNYGARKATGDVLVFLDAHIEATTGWLEPLLHRIKQSPLSVLCPMIDNIDKQTLAYSTGSQQYGTFSWDMFFRWGKIPERVSRLMVSPVDVYPSATMAGGLLATGREFFFRLGAYDDGMEVWGGENLELSFRVRSAF
jgi:polypeptide N-acetylgalactosaminyltransferase